MTKYVAGFDVGGTKTLGVAVSPDRKIVATIKVARPHSGEETVSQMCSLVAEFEEGLGEEIAAVGVGIAGAISREGSVQYSPNIPEIVDFQLRDQLGECLNKPLVVDNDATAATWAESQLGAGRGVADLLYVALGTGIGTGFVLDGRLYRGANGFAGESGHIVVDRHGPKHITDVRGPWEMYASGNGLGALARRRAHEGKLDSVANNLTSIDKLRGEDIDLAVEKGESDALELLDEFAVEVALGITNLIYVLDPAKVVIGGGLVELGEPLRSRIERQVAKTTIGADYRPAVPVVLAELGSKSGALGAALLAADL